MSLMLTATALAAEKNETPAKDPQVKEGAATASKDAAMVHFPEKMHEFEPVVEGLKVTHDFVIQNKGTAVLQIQKVKTG